MSTKILGILRFVCHSEGGKTNAVNRQFSVNLVRTGAVISQSSVLQGQKRVVKVSEAFDITGSYHFIHYFDQVGALP